MTSTRRDFLASGAALAGVAVLPTMAALPTSSLGEEPNDKPAVTLKLSCQVWNIPGKDLDEKLATMEKWGFDAVELPGDIVGNEQKYVDAVKKTKLKVSAICGGAPNGDIVSEDAGKRVEAVKVLKQLLTSAGAVGAVGPILVPAFNGQTKLGNQEIRKILVDTLPAIGEHALKAGTRLILEPLNRKEAFFLRQVADAAAIARDCKSDGIAVMGDFYHMYHEETSDLGAFISGGSRVHHVHLASGVQRILPGQDDQQGERQYVDGFRGLKYIGYQNYCSFECGVRGDATVEIPKSMAFLRDQWEKATELKQG
jgi:sugar phosphate isomerase/epimerase